MNFIAGFLLLVSGGKEEESFWFLVFLLASKYKKQSYSFDPLEGLYQSSFPLLLSHLASFDSLFTNHLPALKSHFDKIGMVP